MVTLDSHRRVGCALRLPALDVVLFVKLHKLSPSEELVSCPLFAVKFHHPWFHISAATENIIRVAIVNDKLDRSPGHVSDVRHSGTDVSSCTACSWWRNEQYVTCTQLLIIWHCNGIKKRSFWNLDPTLAPLYHLQKDRTNAVVQVLTYSCLVYSVALRVLTRDTMRRNPNMETKWNLYKQMEVSERHGPSQNE